MKRLLSLVVLMMAVSTLFAQQDPQFTQWFNDKLSFNPATAGLNNAHCFSAFYRTQWVGFETPTGTPLGLPATGGGTTVVNPRTFMFNYSGAVGKGIGIGLNFYNDQLGFETNNVVKLSGSYTADLANNVKFAGGLSLGFYGKQLGNSWIFIDENDPSIPTNGPNAGVFDLGLGAYIYKNNEWYFGASATHLTGGDMDQLNISIAQHLYFMGGYNFDVNSDWQIRTNALGKWDLNKFAFDVNANAMWMDLLYAGVSYRPGDAIAPMVGIERCMSKTSKTSSLDQC
ncbi:MAG: PorP/SprF family type IX secretion system membrane protein, partial [Bacteroidota bacterium]